LNKIIITVLLIAFPIILSAQQFRAGVTAGVAGTQISGDQLGGFDKAGLMIGGFVSTAISAKFDASMQILYIQKGSSKNANPDNNDFEYYRLRLNYIEVPLLLQWKYSKRFKFEAGPTIGVLLSEEEEDEFGVFEGRPFKKYEFGIAGGMNISIVKQLFLNARLESSVLPVREHVSGLSYRLNAGQYNAALIFSVQYIFGPKSTPAAE
jgi:hypothetical protein